MKEYYGDNPRWFIGEVIDNTPPSGLEGRVRVRIFGVHSPSTRDIPQKDLPWAQVMVPSTEGGVSGVGSNSKLESGAMVFGMFMDGRESQIPLVMGTIPRLEKPSAIQREIELDFLSSGKPSQSSNTNIPKQTQSNFGTPDLSGGVENDTFYSDLINEDANGQFYLNSLVDAEIFPNSSGIADYLTEEDDVTDSIKNARQSTAMRFFLANGYTFKQSCALTAAIRTSSNFLTTKLDKRNGGIGLCSWSGKRIEDLKKFSNNWERFSVQLAFILFELNTTEQKVNADILNTDIIKPVGCQETLSRIIATDYLGYTDNESISIMLLETLKIYEEYEG